MSDLIRDPETGRWVARSVPRDQLAEYQARQHRAHANSSADRARLREADKRREKQAAKARREQLALQAPARRRS